MNTLNAPPLIRTVQHQPGLLLIQPPGDWAMPSGAWCSVQGNPGPGSARKDLAIGVLKPAAKRVFVPAIWPANGEPLVPVSQDTLPSPLAIRVLTKHYYSYCTTSDVYTTPVSTTVNTAVRIVFSNTVRAKRSEDRHRMTPIGVLRTPPPDSRDQFISAAGALASTNPTANQHPHLSGRGGQRPAP